MIEIVVADITSLQVDAVVNAANSTLAGGGGVDYSIHHKAGPELARAAVPLGPCAHGDAVITPGFNLLARYVIHAVGPVWRDGTQGEENLLRRVYQRSFELAKERDDIRSIAFPAISTGAYQFPKENAAAIALEVMRANEAAFDKVVACLWDEENASYYRRLVESRDA